MTNSLSVNDLMRIVARGYPDGFTDYYWDYEKSTVKNEYLHGDTLAKFVVIELCDCYEECATIEYQISQAVRLMRRAQEDLEGVIRSLSNWVPDDRDQTEEAQETA